SAPAVRGAAVAVAGAVRDRGGGSTRDQGDQAEDEGEATHRSRIALKTCAFPFTCSLRSPVQVASLGPARSLAGLDVPSFRRETRIVGRVAFFAGLVCALTAACGGDDASEPPPGDPAPAPSDAGPSTPDDPPRAQVSVGHDREMRGAWVATVNNSTWPSKTGLTPAAS